MAERINIADKQQKVSETKSLIRSLIVEDRTRDFKLMRGYLETSNSRNGRSSLSENPSELASKLESEEEYLSDFIL